MSTVTHPASRRGKVERFEDVLEIDNLQVDHSYQRDLNQNLVEKILTDWDFMAYDALKVSRRKNGDEFIVNGQHTAAAAKLAGETEILAYVYTGLTLAQEADLRLKSNNRRSDTPLERFHARLEAKHKDALALQSLCEEFGTQVNRNASGYHGINCVSALEGVYAVDGGLLLRATFKVLQDAYGEIKSDVATEPVIRGTAWFMRQHSREAARADLKKRMNKTGVVELSQKARSHKIIMGGAVWVNFYRALVEMYNYHRPEKSRLETRTQHKYVIDPDDNQSKRRTASDR